MDRADQKRKKDRRGWTGILRDLLFPPRCPGCDELLTMAERRAGFCRDCLGQLEYVREPCCKKCGRQLSDETEELCGDCRKTEHSFAAGRSVYVYKGCMAKALYRFKYSGRACYSRAFAADAARLYGDWMRRRQIAVILPVPMYERKKKRRGYNQAEKFAAELSRLTGIPMDAGALIRVRDTAPQKNLSRRERALNLKNAFKCRGNVVQSLYEEKCVLLVDDIYTTGTTCDEIAAVLTGAGVRKVYVLCLSSGAGI